MRERVSAFVDGEAGELERAAVRSHLQVCGGCRDFVTFSRRAQRTARQAALSERPTALSPAELSSAARARHRSPGHMRRSLLGLAAALLVGVFTGAVGMEIALREADRHSTVTADTVADQIAYAVAYEPKIAPGKRLDPDYVRYFETAPKPPMVFPVIRVIDPLPPDPSFRWDGLEPGETYPVGYRLEIVSY